MRIAIAGGGVAALEAAIAARNTNADAAITVFAGEKIRPYRRPMLSSLLKGNPVDEKIFKRLGVNITCQPRYKA